MKIAVLNNMAPFARGGAELLAERLCGELESRGHETELIRVPLDWTSPEAVMASAASATCLRVESAELVIALKFPAYLVQHPNLVIWLIHPLRQVHDLWDTPHGWSSTDLDQSAVHDAVITMDKAAMAKAKKVFVISDIIAERLRRTTGIPAEVLMHPPNWTLPMEEGPFGNYILSLGRVGDAKRQILLIRALALTDGDLRLTIAGQPDSDAEADEIRQAVADHGLDDRVDLRLEFISEDEKRSLLAGALGVAYLPIQEDTYGYVCLEAYQAGKPVVTATDSGGTHVLVRDGETGFITEPSPGPLALAFRSLALNRPLAMRMGQAGKALAESLPLDWPTVVRALVS